MALGTPSFAGCGLYLDFGNPLATADPAAQGAVVIVRVFNCSGQTQRDRYIGYPTAETRVTGTAEGLVSGRRVSVPLKIRKLSSPGQSAVHWEPPKEGVWLLNFRIIDPGGYYIDGILQTVVGALVPLQRGAIERRTTLVQAPASQDEIDAALRSMASKD